jgi:septal ring factor EnvC (AmiA/AmiB activator)
VGLRDFFDSGKIEELQNTIIQYERAYARLKREHESLESKHEQLKKEAEQARKENQKLREQLISLEDENDHLRKQNAGLRDAIGRWKKRATGDSEINTRVIEEYYDAEKQVYRITVQLPLPPNTPLSKAVEFTKANVKAEGYHLKSVQKKGNHWTAQYTKSSLSTRLSPLPEML